MEYWKVQWHHSFAEEPVAFYSEIGSDGYEVRKIQEYGDGCILKADAEHETREIGLSEIPVGRIEDVQAQAEFSAFTSTREEFEAVWSQASWSR